MICPRREGIVNRQQTRMIFVTVHTVMEDRGGGD